MIENVQFLFAPADPIQQTILTGATKEATLPGAGLFMSMYGFHLPPLRDVFLANHAAGVAQQILLDLSEEISAAEHPDVVTLINAGLDIVIGTSPLKQILHSKYLLLKAQQTVMTGSYNFSLSAAEQDNTMQVFTDTDVYNAFLTHFTNARQWCLTNEPQDQIKAAIVQSTSVAKLRVRLRNMGLTVPAREA